MKIIISTIKFYPYKGWFFLYYKFKFVKGFNVRILGVEIKIIEVGHREKLIELFKLSARKSK